MLHVLPSNNPKADATGALSVILHAAAGFRGGQGGSLLPGGDKNMALETQADRVTPG